MGSDYQDLLEVGEDEQFQSTLPVWRATGGQLVTGTLKQFQSTLPVWGATAAAFLALHLHLISIHAPRVGSDHTAV